MTEHKKRYQNPDNIGLTTTFRDLLRWRRERKQKVKDFSLQVEQTDAKQIAFLQANRSVTSVTWIGHATFLLQAGGLNILTDPVWAKRMGTAKRLAPPGIYLSELPEIDMVLISHNHYDHLDFPTLKRLPGSPLILIPHGSASSFQRRGFRQVQEFVWRQSLTVRDAELTFLPAQHWSRRSLWDTNKSHWGGWLIRSAFDNKSLYFVGDSGYFRGFKDLSRRGLEAILAPIGCYEPEWFMHIQHMTPEEAVQAYLDSKANLFIPMHYEAFALGDDTPQEALDRLKQEWSKRRLPEEKLKCLELGETITFN